MITAPPPAESRPALARRWVALWSALGVLVVGGVVVGNVLSDREQRRLDQLAATEPSAYEAQGELNQVVAETAALLGLTAEGIPRINGSLACIRPDGVQGFSYLAHTIEDVALPDLTTGLTEARHFWEGMGYAVSERQIGETTVLSGHPPDGGSIQVFANAQGTALKGQTFCSLTDGGPED
ncbi:hypothetical protein [Actinotalea sp. JY-7885]|uniref:hypothetical protein n=1 Tax=Actinotalea sp. JY-7885 TaxID=2758576 RepID=UPI00165E9531|nr:hypothetical protein [Actinotalea sp. JY-7885]